jgi:hypothetical protein
MRALAIRAALPLPPIGYHARLPYQNGFEDGLGTLPPDATLPASLGWRVTMFALGLEVPNRSLISPTRPKNYDFFRHLPNFARSRPCPMRRAGDDPRNANEDRELVYNDELTASKVGA